MSAEILDSPAAESFRCHDGSGKELFPVEQMVAAAGLARLLAPELKRPLRKEGMLNEDVSDLSRILETAHCSTMALQHYGGYQAVREQRRIQENVQARVEFGKAQLVRDFLDLRDATYRTAPNEIEYFKRIVIAEEREPGELDYARAGLYSQSPIVDVVRGSSAMLQENTPDNLEDLTNIADSFDALMFLEGQALSAQLIDVCLAFGSHRDLRTTVSMSKKLANLAVDSDKELPEKVINQQEVADSMVDITKAIAGRSVESRDSSVVMQYIDEITGAAHELTHGHVQTSSVLHHVINSRAFRLNGGTRIILPSVRAEEETASAAADQTLQEEIIPQPAPPTRPEPKEQKPDFFSQYASKFHDLLNKINCRQPVLLTAKEIKRRSLDEARAILVRGERDDSGAPIINGRSKSDAQSFISNIEFLCSFITEAGDIERARKKLDEAVSESSSASSKISSFFEEAGEKLDRKSLSHLQNRVPALQPIENIITDILNEWDAVSWLVWEHWPDGPKTSQQLRKLLFFSEHNRRNVADSADNSAQESAAAA